MSGLSGWPDHFKDKTPARRRSSELIEVEFDPEMYVAVVTELSIGLKESEDDPKVLHWIPISLIDGSPPERGAWISAISIPEWKADELGI